MAEENNEQRADEARIEDGARPAQGAAQATQQAPSAAVAAEAALDQQAEAGAQPADSVAEDASPAQRPTEPAQPAVDPALAGDAASHAAEEAYAHGDPIIKRDGKSKFAKKRERAKKVAYEKTPDRFKNATSFQVRFRTGFVYVAVSIVCVLINDLTTTLYLMLVAAICAGEFCYMMRVDAKMPNETIGVIGAAAYPLSMYLYGLEGVAVCTVALMLALFIWYVYWMRARVADVSVSFFGAAYTGMLLSSLLLIRHALPEPWGGVLLLLLFCSVWFNDAMAYIIGSHFGKHKLAPRTSPKKSWEGLIAGLATSALFWFIMTFVPGVTMDVPTAIVFGVLCGIAGVVGDLAESRIKRNVGVKDSGTIMPGHGGLLDRCDSLFFSSVAAAILLFFGGCVPYV